MGHEWDVARGGVEDGIWMGAENDDGARDRVGDGAGDEAGDDLEVGLRMGLMIGLGIGLVLGLGIDSEMGLATPKIVFCFHAIWG